MSRRCIVGAAAALILMSACDAAPPPASPAADVVHVISVELTVDGEDGLLTFAAHNAGAETDVLTGATCTCGGTVEILGDPSIAPQQTVLFTGDPGVSFDAMTTVPDRGSSVDVVLTFQRAGDVPVTADVRAARRSA